MSRSLSSDSQKQRGAAYIELVPVLFLLLLFLFGIAHVGREFSQVTWYSSVNYETALRGARSNTSIGEQEMENVFGNLKLIHSSNRNTRIEFSDSNLESTLYDTAPDVREVTVDSIGVATKLFNKLPTLDFDMGYTSPLLLSSPDLSAGNLDIFEDEDSDFCYNCDGSRQEIALDGPCETACYEPGGIDPPPDPPTCFAAETSIAMADGSQRPIASLRRGDWVLSLDVETQTLQRAQISATMTADVDSYYILNGYLQVTAEHPFFSQGRWVPVAELRIGDSLETLTGTPLRLESKALVKRPLSVFNITVMGEHNYYAGGVLVHNKEPIPIDGIFVRGF
jgi:hypothetical protein